MTGFATETFIGRVAGKNILVLSGVPASKVDVLQGMVPLDVFTKHGIDGLPELTPQQAMELAKQYGGYATKPAGEGK